MKFTPEEICPESVPLEEVRIALGALMKHLNLRLYREEGFYREVAYTVSPATPSRQGEPNP